MPTTRITLRAFLHALACAGLIAALCVALSDSADARRSPRRARAAAAAPAPPTPISRHVAIIDGATGALLACEDCETPMAPASMSKLMTILVVAEALQARRITENTAYEVSENAWRHGASSDGSHMFLEIHSRVRVGDLIRGVIIVSANDACIVLAEGLFGSEEAFVAEMNKRARELGLTSARFRNTTGLPDPEHVISAGDLGRLARLIITQHPEIYRLYSQRDFTFNRRTQQNRNPLLGAFAGADGVKTGHTDESGYGLVGSATLNHERRIIVFNGARTMAERASEAERLMRSAFFDFGVVRLAEKDQQVGEAEVYLGGRARVPLVAAQPIAIGMSNNVRDGLSAAIVYQGPLRAPIRKGQEIAELVVEGPGFPRRSFPLVAGRRIGGANWFAQVWTGIARTFAPRAAPTTAPVPSGS